MWPVLANQLGSSSRRAEFRAQGSVRAQFRAAQKRLDKSLAFTNARLAAETLASSEEKSNPEKPWAAEPKLEFKGGWLKRIAERNNIQKYFLRAQ